MSTANEIKFRRDTSFRKVLFSPESFAHPAKMDAQLLLWIVERYTKAGDTILDPMAGSGTAMVGCTVGRNIVQVELEQKFVDMQKANWRKVRMIPQLGHEMGECQIIQGDARQLGHILADHAIFSPPYAAAQSGGGIAQEGYTKDYQKDKIGGGNLDPVGKRSYMPENAGAHPNNIQFLPYGDIDSIVTSPPYEGSLELSSRHTKGGIPGRDAKLGQTGTYATVDSIVTSPPYEAAVTGKNGIDWTKATRGAKEGWKSRDRTIEPSHAHLPGQGQPFNYSDSKDNIGNLKADSYLAAMLQVYQQCRKVLKPGGLMIVVTKNFIRNKQEVRLDEDTIRLCEQAGFKFVERHYRKLPAQSFWRVIYQQKYPDAPVLDKEDILVFQS